MKLLWLIAAGSCIVIAAVLLLLGQFNAAFVVAVLGLVSWFLNYRAQVSQDLRRRESSSDLTTRRVTTMKMKTRIGKTSNAD